MNKFAAICIVATALSLSAKAQLSPESKPASAEVKTAKPVKIGYTNVNYVLSISPASKVIQKQLEETQKQYMKTIEDKNKELEAKFEAYQKGQATMLESIKKDKEEELRNLQRSIQTLQENAQEDQRKNENDLVKPELDKIYKAVNEVSKANDFTHVFNSDQVLLYAEEQSDITDLVLDKLGIKAPAAGETKMEEPKTAPATNPAPKPATMPSPAKKSGGKK
jgi:outer membrane protein